MGVAKNQIFMSMTRETIRIITIALVALLLRVKLMEHAWHGRRFDLPLMERLTRKYY